VICTLCQTALSPLHQTQTPHSAFKGSEERAGDCGPVGRARRIDSLPAGRRRAEDWRVSRAPFLATAEDWLDFLLKRAFRDLRAGAAPDGTCSSQFF
jgi:hypothetical protein